MASVAPKAPLTSYPVYSAIRGCRECRLHGGCIGPVPGIGPGDSRIVVVGESPGEREDETGIPFTGPTGRLLDHLLRMAGISLSLIHISEPTRPY